MRFLVSAKEFEAFKEAVVRELAESQGQVKELEGKVAELEARLKALEAFEKALSEHPVLVEILALSG